jgi:ubiquinone biosynthesis protein UbiJ
MTDQVTKNLSRSFADHFCEFTEFKVKVQKALDELAETIDNLQIANAQLSERIFNLEEKERQRDRDEWARELALDSGPPDYIPLGDE